MQRASFPELDRQARLPLTAQIVAFYAEAIRDGRLRAGDRLPPIRDISKACDCTRAVVQDAYRLLATRGLVEGTVGRGTTVLASARPDAVAADGAAG
ncbi:MAG: winged helix-turn-helix domain-containing protein, partial [Planctomycetota bacterium]|nr:winged helix-turn-helix domain-containing protein [Planctomycetota bacterium]